MMRFFQSYDKQKINFVDEFNTFIGYDFSSKCCEDFGFIITKKQLTEEELRNRHSSFICEDDLSAEKVNHVNSVIEKFRIDTAFTRLYSIAGNSKDEKDKNVCVFRFYTEDKDANIKEAFLTLINMHTGYYSHGFVFESYNLKAKGAL